MSGRTATAQWLRRLHKVMLLYKPGGLEHFDGLAVLTKSNLLDGVRTGKFVDMAALVKFMDMPAPASFSVASDEEQLQITAMDFGEEVLGLTSVHFRDYYHRVPNDLFMGTAMSGFMPTYWAGLFAMNLGYGPWQSGA